MALRLLRTLTAGQSIVVDAAAIDAVQITVLAEAGATVTISRVNSAGATAATGHGSDSTVAANTRSTILVDWPYYFISTAGGSARVAAV